MATTATQNPASSGQPMAESSTSAAAAAAVYQRLHPDSYLSRYLAKDYRPDGRTVKQWRDVSINAGSISTAEGSALVRMGETTIVCGIKAEVAEPNTSTPEEGFVVPNVDLPAICSPKFKPGPPGDEAQTLSNWLNDLIVSSQTLPTSSLCIRPGKAVWAIYIDVVCINYDGNAFDATVLAVMAALRNTRLPRANWNDETSKVVCVRDETYPLPLGRIPLSCSFGIFRSSYLLPDPTSFEAPLLPTTLTIALDEQSRGYLVRNEGLGGVTGQSGEKIVAEAWALAEKRAKELREILQDSVAA
ncbi:ribosomal protein S5 domain 2-type protein [Papiliotrema laurentii]|uniref:Ribosomal RNA-processing protein 43 n=1 Tax=Papiliotrema laurentii TaxID=5418 RepID=A0AAD9CVL6_PAPLA|nr:ribosomal protein S5 domain 2-type protein [Papiliotrema laurentii]